MSREVDEKNRWWWMPEQMPAVSRLIAERRASEGPEWLAECWKHGVVKGEPGWFFAGEGSLMVGTMWDEPDVMAFATAKVTRTQAVLVIKAKGAA